MREEDGRGETCIVCGLLYGVTDFGVHAIADVDGGGSFLEHTKGLDQGGRESLRGATDVKVLEGAAERVSRRRTDGAGDMPLCLCAPVAVCGHLEVAKRVALESVRLGRGVRAVRCGGGGGDIPCDGRGQAGPGASGEMRLREITWARYIP